MSRRCSKTFWSRASRTSPLTARACTTCSRHRSGTLPIRTGRGFGAPVSARECFTRPSASQPQLPRSAFTDCFSSRRHRAPRCQTDPSSTRCSRSAARRIAASICADHPSTATSNAGHIRPTMPRCQDMADAARVGRYPGHPLPIGPRPAARASNCAVLAVAAFADRSPRRQQTWHIFPGRHSVRAWCENPRAAVEFRREDFQTDPRVAAAMPSAAAPTTRS